MKSDDIGMKVIDKLTEKVKEGGVEVKVLYDGMGGRKLKHSFDEFKEAGGEVAVVFSTFCAFLYSEN